MKRRVKLLIASIAILIMASAAVYAVQISLDSAATFPSDI